MAGLTLVVLPGLDGTGLLLAPFVAALPADVRAIVVPYPGDRRATYDELAALVRDQLPRDEPFLLVGESFGGPLAAVVAASRPAGLVGLVLCASFVTSPRPIVGPALRALASPLVFRLYPVYRRVREWLGRSRPSIGTWASAADASRQVRPDVMAHRVRLALSVDARAALAGCGVPVLYLRGSRDGVVPAGNLRRVRRVRPDVSVVTLRSSHQVLQRRPAEAMAAIVAFGRPLVSGA